MREGPGTGRLQVGLPAYFYPWPGSPAWADVERLPQGSLVVLDPADGPGVVIDPRYVEVASRARGAGVRLLGYVDTAYAQRPAVEVVADAMLFRDWYGVDAVFLDRALLHGQHLDHYDALVTRLRDRGLRVALNPGQPELNSRALHLADHIVVFEGSYEEYGRDGFPEPHADALDDALWHLVYDVPTSDAMREVVALARARGATRLFVTDRSLPNPWDGLPAYWLEELEELEVLAGRG